MKLNTTPSRVAIALALGLTLTACGGAGGGRVTTGSSPTAATGVAAGGTSVGANSSLERCAAPLGTLAVDDGRDKEWWGSFGASTDAGRAVRDRRHERHRGSHAQRRAPAPCAGAGSLRPWWLGAIALPAAADDGATGLAAVPRAAPAREQAGDTVLYLAVVLNQVPHPGLLPFLSREGRLLAGPTPCAHWDSRPQPKRPGSVRAHSTPSRAWTSVLTARGNRSRSRRRWRN